MERCVPPMVTVKIKSLAFSSFPHAGDRWHVSRDRERMIFLIVSFVILGSLLCALVGADHQASDAVETARVRTFENR
jgi:hypothetical protein